MLFTFLYSTRLVLAHVHSEVLKHTKLPLGAQCASFVGWFLCNKRKASNYRKLCVHLFFSCTEYRNVLEQRGYNPTAFPAECCREAVQGPVRGELNISHKWQRIFFHERLKKGAAEVSLKSADELFHPLTEHVSRFDFRSQHIQQSMRPSKRIFDPENSPRSRNHLQATCLTPTFPFQFILSRTKCETGIGHSDPELLHLDQGCPPLASRFIGSVLGRPADLKCLLR